MMKDPNTKNLAETLARTGLAASATEAAKMAQSIMGTDRKVSEHFNKQNDKIDKSLSRKRTYEEEIDYLIQKTSPENKNYHIPVRGFTRDDEPIEDNEPVEKVEIPVAEPHQPEMSNMPVKMPEVQPVQETEVQPIKKLEVVPILEPTMEEPKPAEESIHVELEEPEMSNMPVKEVKAVYTDLETDERTLNEIMNEDAAKVYNQEAPKKEEEDDFLLGESATQEPKVQQVEQAQPEVQETQEFSDKSERVSPEPDQVQRAPEPEEVEEEEKKEFDNPIDDVDLMNYFKFG